MEEMSSAGVVLDQSARMERYYRLHAKIYDATRWSFLFGRKTIIQQVAAITQPANILEIGCGTGKNLLTLAQTFPQAKLSGLDISESMLKVAAKNLGARLGSVELLHRVYDRPLHPAPHFDLILCSYSLSMMNPDWQKVIQYAKADLNPGGFIAVVDFHDSAVPLFKQWMGVNHVRMDGHLLPALAGDFQPQYLATPPAYGGLWQYFLFVGLKKPPSPGKTAMS
ncbi:MAG: class I SAM-dependent methyltransferase [Anaerolineae bacterium]|nr:class I SAM-dependent methyltransferase [Anaerolineae bacterium]